jgi:uncharacterized membrane protein
MFKHFIIILFILGSTAGLYPEDNAEAIVFNAYKSLHIGYSLARAGLIFSAPLIGHENGQWIYDYFSNECHQLPDRSLRYAGNYMPVCARCTGIILGQFIGQAAYLALADMLNETVYSEENFWPTLGILFIGMLPLIIDGTIQLKTDYRSNNPLRVSTGILFGVSVSLACDVCMLGFTRLIKNLLYE